MPKKAKLPYLDNIETSASLEFCPELNNINASGPCKEKNLSTALKSFDYYKKLSDNIASTLILCATPDDIVFGDRAAKLLDCGTDLVLSESGRVVSANFCRMRICPMCQKRRSLRVYSDFCKIMDFLGDVAYLHLVLTVPNCSAAELSDLLDLMQICASRFFGLDFIKKAFKGVARCTEVTYNKNADTYHPHFHCLVAVNKSYFKSRYYLKIDDVRRFWTVIVQAALNGIKVKNRGDKFFMEQASAFDPDTEILYQCSITKASEGVLPEIAKYCVKPLDIDLVGFDLFEPLKVIFKALHGRRLIQFYGVIADAARALCVDPDTFSDDELSDLSDTVIDNEKIFRYNWNRACKKYIKF